MNLHIKVNFIKSDLRFASLLLILLRIYFLISYATNFRAAQYDTIWSSLFLFLLAISSVSISYICWQNTFWSWPKPQYLADHLNHSLHLFYCSSLKWIQCGKRILLHSLETGLRIWASCLYIGWMGVKYRLSLKWKPSLHVSGFYYITLSRKRNLIYS